MIQPQNQYENQNFSGLTLEQHTFEAIEFSNCTFIDCFFSESVLQQCKFLHCNFLKCDLSLIRIIECTFSGNEFRKSRLTGIDWTQAQWGSTLLKEPQTFDDCQLNHSTFIGLDLKGVSQCRFSRGKSRTGGFCR